MNDAVFEDAFNLLCGDLIARGAHRKVFVCKLRDDLVVKVEDEENRRFANVLEMEFWDNYQFYEPVAKWLAPVIKISPDGRVLLQKRCQAIPAGYELPEKVPHFFTDIKVENFGLFEGRFVCLDYAYTRKEATARLKKVEWMVGM